MASDFSLALLEAKQCLQTSEGNDFQQRSLLLSYQIIKAGWRHTVYINENKLGDAAVTTTPQICVAYNNKNLFLAHFLNLEDSAICLHFS